MNDYAERRREKRLRYHWPVWFAEDFNEELTQGQMVDVSSEGAAFTCYSDRGNLYTGQPVTARFSVPKFETDESFGMSSFTRHGHVCRVENVNDFIRKIAIQFAEPLPFKPGEQTEDEVDTRERLKAVTI
ncbi:MAG: PilZ domain-containing protein [Sedimentisphaerales bacterium]|nr:PilZ domain-containing protein [Sedimentisphaerales bacterium]